MKETSKNRHTVWLTDEAWKMVGDQYKGDNCSTQNEYIEKAIRFYVGYRTRSATVTIFPTRCPICWKEV